MAEWTHAIDFLAYPDNDEFYSPATKLMGREPDGRGAVSDTILWIAADRSYAVCDDGFWWLS